MTTKRQQPTNVNPFPGGEYRVSRSPSGWHVYQQDPRDPANRQTVFRATYTGGRTEAENWKDCMDVAREEEIADALAELRKADRQTLADCIEDTDPHRAARLREEGQS